MQLTLDVSSFIFLISVVLCLLGGSILLIFSKSRAVNNKWLAAYYLCIGYGILVGFLLNTKLITHSPWYHVYRTGYISGMVLMPLSFFYFRSLFRQIKFKPIDLVHFLPVTLYIIDFTPFYLSEPAYKVQQLATDVAALNS